MERIQDHIGKELRLTGGAWEKTSELRIDQMVIANIDWPRLFKQRAAYARAADGSWDITPAGGLLIFRYDISAHGSALKLGALTYSRKATLTLADGTTYAWQGSLWDKKFEWLDQKGQSLMRYGYARISFLKYQKTVVVDAKAADLKELSMMVLLGFFLIRVTETVTTTLIAC